MSPASCSREYVFLTSMRTLGTTQPPVALICRSSESAASSAKVRAAAPLDARVPWRSERTREGVRGPHQAGRWA
jgi:hypothetical protein